MHRGRENYLYVARRSCVRPAGEEDGLRRARGSGRLLWLSLACGGGFRKARGVPQVLPRVFGWLLCVERKRRCWVLLLGSTEKKGSVLATTGGDGSVWGCKSSSGL